jgi:glycerol-3-phosphate O-acyltransferase
MTQASIASGSLYLLDAEDDIDERILRRWVEQHAAGAELLPLSSSTDGSLADALVRHGDVRLGALRVAWLPTDRDGDRTVRIRDVARGDPHNPNRRRKEQILRSRPDGAQVVVADTAMLSELRVHAAAPSGDNPAALAAFVARQGALSLERAEYRIRGARYKAPSLVREQLSESAAFRRRADELAASLNREPDDVWREVLEYLDEMVTGYAPLFLDMMARLGKRLLRTGYGDTIDYDPEQLKRLRKTLATNPAVILPSHKSNFDALVIPVALHENGLPPTLTFAGINMAFWPTGAIFRRAGRIFIRREMKELPVYRWVLREYLGYLVEKRFTLEWYIEGTRSRTGKLGPPMLGLLRYIADACREGRTDDVAMVPASIIYDQLHEVSEFAAESKGSKKKAESLGWVIKSLKSQRRRRQLGRIYVRFGEPISLREAVGPADGASDDYNLRLQKLGFEVCTRINAITPITASALICLALLAVRGRALTARELHSAMKSALDQAEMRGLPLAESARQLDTEEGVLRAAASLAASDTIEVYDAGDQPVYRVKRGHHLAAAFYRNTIVHYFVGGSIGELALIHAAELHVPAAERVEAFWTEAFHLRRLLEFDFFFEQREQFRETLADEIRGRLPGWEEQLLGGVEPSVLLDKMQPLNAFAVVRPFIDSYLVVARALLQTPAKAEFDRKAFVKRCLSLGEQWVRQDRVRSPEAVSKHMFERAIKLAEYRKLTALGSDVSAADLTARRREFLDELADVARRIDIVEERTYESVGRSLNDPRW